jgi:myo-inositol-1(or 4)-monophosphatase
MDARGVDGRPLLAGNIKVAELLQQRIVNTGYASAFD